MDVHCESSAEGQRDVGRERGEERWQRGGVRALVMVAARMLVAEGEQYENWKWEGAECWQA